LAGIGNDVVEDAFVVVYGIVTEFGEEKLEVSVFIGGILGGFGFGWAPGGSWCVGGCFFGGGGSGLSGTCDNRKRWIKITHCYPGRRDAIKMHVEESPVVLFCGEENLDVGADPVGTGEGVNAGDGGQLPGLWMWSFQNFCLVGMVRSLSLGLKLLNVTQVEEEDLLSVSAVSSFFFLSFTWSSFFFTMVVLDHYMLDLS
jgi:hypothetical protein